MAKKFYESQKAWRPPEIHKLISSVRDLSKRNLLRGFSAKLRLHPSDAEAIRASNAPPDSLAAGAILKGPYGLWDPQFQNKKRTSKGLFTLTAFPPETWRSEVCYTVGYLNSLSTSAVDLLRKVRPLCRLEELESAVALEILHALAEEHGASNFLSFKLAYLRSARQLLPTDLATATKIEDEIAHRETPGLHFSALEVLGARISLFAVAQRRISGLLSAVNGNFRRALSLSNFISTPLDQEDAAGFLLRATESSLLDTIQATAVIFNLGDDFKDVKREFESQLDRALLVELQNYISYAAACSNAQLVTDQYKTQIEAGNDSLDLYRISSAFLERPDCAQYRNKIDRVVGPRLLAEIVGNKFNSLIEPFSEKAWLLAPDNSAVHENLPVTLDPFYRTYLFIRFISDRNNILTLTKDEVRFVFEHTVGLEALLTEEEMRALYITAPPETKGFMNVLALALFRTKSVDPDVDFEFRAEFIQHINAEHGGSVVAFINYLLDGSPQIASYIIASLDEVTLQKLYTLVENASQASEIRRQILTAVGERLNRIEYIVEADAIATRFQVSKLQQYFDNSRMYVDSIAMKKWLDANPTVATEQYRALYPRVHAKLSGVNDSLVIISLSDQDEYLLSEIAEEAFQQFCLNTEFGIQSYLGRRIRHNTLDGVTTETVDAVLRRQEFGAVLSSPSMRRTVLSWTEAYKSIVDKLRRDHLQFDSPGALFRSTLDLDDATTKENIGLLARGLRTTGGSELLNDLVISFCWKQISPQLENAARFIRTTVLTQATASIDKYFSGLHGAMEGQVRTELHEAVNDVFKKVADWFQVPQTGFISASGRDLCQIIIMELGLQPRVRFSGGAVDTKYTGISVHRLYDCLAVLLQNANKHSESGSAISIDMHASRSVASAAFDLLHVTIATTVSAEDYDNAKRRILSAIDAAESGDEMVKEGYTGIKKIKFITRRSEGASTVVCNAEDTSRTLDLGFKLHAEIAMEHVEPEAAA